MAGLLRAVPPVPPGGCSQLLCQEELGWLGASERIWCIPPLKEDQFPGRAEQGVPRALKPTRITAGAQEPGNKLGEGVLNSRGAWQAAARQLKELAPAREGLK